MRLRNKCALLICVFILFCFLSVSAEKLDFSQLEKLDGFYYSDSSKTNWTYSQKSTITVSENTNIKMILVLWGNEKELTYYPQLRVLINKDGHESLAYGMTAKIDNSMFNIDLKALNLKDIVAGYCAITEDSQDFISALSIAKVFCGIVHLDNDSIMFELTDTELSPLRQFMTDLLSNDLLNHINENKKKERKTINQETPIQSFVYDSSQEQYDDIAGNDDLVDYAIPEIGMQISFPSKYTVLTKNMNDEELIRANTTIDEVNDYLSQNGYSLYAFTEDEHRTLHIYSHDMDLPDTWDMSDEELELAGGVLGFSISYLTNNGIYLHNKVLRINGIAYARITAAEVYTKEDNSIKSILHQLYFVVNNQKAIIMEAVCDESMDEGFREIEDIIIPSIRMDGIGDPVRKPALRTFTVEKGPFDVSIDTEKYNVVMPGMSDDEPAVKNSGMTANELKMYLIAGNTELRLFNKDETLPADFEINIRVKDQKYNNIDLRILSEDELQYFYEIFTADLMTGYNTNVESVQLVYINEVPYIHYKWLDDTEERYATIINGDMIYIFAQKRTAQINDNDSLALKEIVDAIAFPDILVQQ